MAVFKRKYALSISSPTKLKPDPNTPWKFSVADAFKDLPRTVDVFTVTDLRMIAKISATVNNSSSPYTEIKLFNASEEVKNKLKEPLAYISLAAGYELEVNEGQTTESDELPVIFIGDVIESLTTKEGNDVITTIKAKDSELAKSSGYISVLYTSGTHIKDILTDIVNKYMPKVSVGLIKVGDESNGPITNPKTSLNFPFVSYGRVTDVLDELAKDFEIEWYIIGNKFYAHGKNYQRAREEVLIRPENVVDNIFPANSVSVSGTAGAQAGIRVKLFLDGRIDTSKYLNVQGSGDDFDGIYKIVEVRHTLDNRGKDWFTHVTASGVK